MQAPTDSAVDLWTFCEALYREPGMEAFCLQLQDQQQVNVLVLLWCVWLDARGLFISSDELAVVARSVNRKSCETIIPLRQLRRRLKGQLDVPEGVRHEARVHLLQAELVLEKQLLQELEAMTVDTGNSCSAGLAPLNVLIEIEALEIPGEELSLFRRTAIEALRRLENAD